MYTVCTDNYMYISDAATIPFKVTGGQQPIKWKAYNIH